MITINYPTNSDLGTDEVVTFHTFSGGEEHVNLKRREFDTEPTIIIIAQILNSADVMRLLLTTDALRRLYTNDIALVMPYLPYARQDRACVEGDAFSLQVFAKLINAQDYDQVTVVDAHSSVAGDLFRNFNSIPQASVLANVRIGIDERIAFIVAPDAGAAKKAVDWQTQWNNIPSNYAPTFFLQATKKRDETGNIVATELNGVSEGALNGATCLIVDDIIDGGRTYIELAKVLKWAGAGNIYLYATHGIFSRGIQVLLDAGITKVFTTDSFPEKDDGRVIVKRFSTERSNYIMQSTKKKVFLGGTCNGSTWRDTLIPLLNIDFFNPVVADWTEAAYEEELKQREECDFCLYVITAESSSIYSIAEVVDGSNKRPTKTVFCFLEDMYTDHEVSALGRVAKMVAENGGQSFNTLGSVARYLNGAA
jgi:ribose-phosphate pyrophosphokinase